MDNIMLSYGYLEAMSRDFVEGEPGKRVLNQEKFYNYVRRVADMSYNALRLYLYGCWISDQRRDVISPFGYDPIRDLFILREFDESYFKVLGEMLEIANAPTQEIKNPGDGLKCIIQLVDNCQMFPGGADFPLRGLSLSPFQNNVEGISGIYDMAAWGVWGALARRVWGVMNGRNVIYSYGNEITGEGAINLCKEILYPLAKEMRIPVEAMEYGTSLGPRYWDPGLKAFVDKKNVQGIEVGYDDQGKLKSAFEQVFSEMEMCIPWRPVHSCLNNDGPDPALHPYGRTTHEAIDWFLGNPNFRIKFSDDGSWNGDPNADRSVLSTRVQMRPSPQQWGWFAGWMFPIIATNYSFTLAHKRIAFEHLPKNFDLDVQQKTADAIADAYRAAFRIELVNRGKYPNDWQGAPKPKPPEPKPPEPQPKKKFSLWQWFREGLGWRVLLWRKRDDWFGIPDWWAVSSVKQKVISLAIVAAIIVGLIVIL